MALRPFGAWHTWVWRLEERLGQCRLRGLRARAAHGINVGDLLACRSFEGCGDGERVGPITEWGVLVGSCDVHRPAHGQTLPPDQRPKPE